MESLRQPSKETWRWWDVLCFNRWSITNTSDLMRCLYNIYFSLYLTIQLNYSWFSDCQPVCQSLYQIHRMHYDLYNSIWRLNKATQQRVNAEICRSNKFMVANIFLCISVEGSSFTRFLTVINWCTWPDSTSLWRPSWTQRHCALFDCISPAFYPWYGGHRKVSLFSFSNFV